MKIQALLHGATQSTWGLKKLNLALSIGIPFNKAHGIKVASISPTKVETMVPYKRRNLNHIKGTHACALATVAEFSAGLLLMSNLPADTYRIIMRNIGVEYFYQCKKDAKASSEMSEDVLKNELIPAIAASDEPIYREVETQLHDSDGKHLATAKTLWQIKAWDKVKTKV